MKILIVGLGTIGEPLARLLISRADNLEIEEVIVHKYTPDIESRGMLSRFHELGAKIAVNEDRAEEFQKIMRPLNFQPEYSFEEALAKSDVIIDCTQEGTARMLKEKYYKRFAGLGKLFVAQGSEKGFGIPYAYDINDQMLDKEKQFVQVVSCNTHQILCILKTIASGCGNQGYNEIEKARFVILRRASDISETDSTVGVELNGPVHPKYGSHQAEDAARVLRTINVDLDIHAQAAKTNNPFMHVVYFFITLKTPTTKEKLEECFRKNPLTATTYRLTNNEVFAEGRDWGHFGRILNQTVVCLPSLEVSPDGKEIYGACFTPQDGNAILSSVAIVLWFKNPKSYRQEMVSLFYKLPFLFEEV